MNRQTEKPVNYDMFAAHTAAAREYGRLKARAVVVAARAKVLKDIADRLKAEEAANRK